MAFHSRCGVFRSDTLPSSLVEIYDTLFGSTLGDHTNAACPTVDDVCAHVIAMLCMATDGNDFVKVFQYFCLQVRSGGRVHGVLGGGCGCECVV